MIKANTVNEKGDVNAITIGECWVALQQISSPDIFASLNKDPSINHSH